MSDVNRATFTGRLTADPQLRVTGSGTEVLSFSVAVNETTKDRQTGELKERASFIDCAVFGKRANGLSRAMRKGAPVAVDGRLRQTSWEDKDGRRRSRLEVVVDELRLFGARPEGGQAQGAEPQAQGEPAGYDLYDADMPF